MCSVTLNQLESLSNEILLEIFEYLDAYNLYQAFHGINHRINTLLQSANLHIISKAVYDNKLVWDNLISFVNPSQIRILSSYDDDTDIYDRFLSSTKESLYSVHLFNTPRKLIDEICQHLPNNNQIKSLHIREKYVYQTSTDRKVIDIILVNHADQLTSLINLSLSLGVCTQFPIVSVMFSQLRRLSINNCYLTSDIFPFLRDRTPNLRSLQFLGYDYISLKPSEFVSPHIHELHIRNRADMYYWRILFSMFPCLRRLHIDWEDSRRSQVINGTQWQELIEKYLPHLKQLTIDFDEGTNEEIVKTFYTSDFWSTKKVNVKMTINKTLSRYPLVKTIYFGRQWRFGYFDHYEM